MKVFGIGVQKTGTTTLGFCFRQYGYRHRGYDHSAIFFLRNGDYQSLFEICEVYDSFEDQPFASMYKAVDARYPDAKFVLTVRSSSDRWYDSMCRHCRRIPGNEHRAFFFGHEVPFGHKQDYVDAYERHNVAVRQHFAGRPGKLLEVCWENGDGWEQLSAFLGEKVPRKPFPHKNRAPSIGRRIVSRIRRLIVLSR